MSGFPILFAGAALGLSTLSLRGDGVEEPIASRIPSRETGSEREHLSGEWLGVRTRLVDSGIHFAAGFTAEVLSNVSGGAERGSAYAGLFEMGLQLDGARLFGLSGSEFQISSLYPQGSSISRYSGDLSAVSNIDGYDTLRLFELWAQQSFWEGRFSLRLGQLAADEEFAVADYSAIFINSSLGWPPFFSANTPAPAYPVAALGARVGLEVTERVHFAAAVFDGDPGSEQLNNTGTHVRLGSDEGVLAVFEAGYAPGSGEGSLAGQYKVGGWYHTGDFDHQRLDDGGLSLAAPGSSLAPGTLGGNWGVYFVVDQPLWREGGDAEAEGLNLFFRGGGHPGDRNLLGYYLDGGVVYNGLLPGRPEDVLGLGVSYWRIGDEARRLSRELGGGGGASLDHEITIEATYEVRLNSWWSLQPDLQYVIHPGGSGELSNALVVGVRSSVVF